MLTLTRPSPQAIRDFLASERERPFSYPSPGASRTMEAPPGYVVDRHRVRLGAGPEAFARARAALRRWEMFRLGWVELFWPDTPVEPGATVAVLVRRLGIYALNATRVVYVEESHDEAPVARFAFAYGTLPEHVESGEERFEVEWRRGSDDSVWYAVSAFSRPHHPIAWAAYPWVRLQQRRFARDSLAAMRRACIG